MSNRERILDVALRLFNERGTAAVSTNHIAAAASVSPGNLYYHFQNKEEVIRALFERLFEAHARFLVLPEGPAPTVADLRRMVRTNFNVLWESALRTASCQRCSTATSVCALDGTRFAAGTTWVFAGSWRRSRRPEFWPHPLTTRRWSVLWTHAGWSASSGCLVWRSAGRPWMSVNSSAG